MRSYLFSKYIPSELSQGGFDELFKLFTQLLQYTAGDVPETMAWMSELDKQYNLTKDVYGMGNFYDDLKDKGYVKESPNDVPKLTSKSEQAIRQSALEEIFGKLKKAGRGQHGTNFSGLGDEKNANRREFRYGDSADMIDLPKSIQNAQINHGIQDFNLTEADLEVEEKDFKTTTSTVVMIDISHSMILYGEDRITPAKKVAMALAELIRTKYRNDHLDIITFGNDARQIELKDLPYLEVGPFHTNTLAGLQLATDLLQKRKGGNKQIFMITDGKPSCMKVGLKYYKNSFGLDRKIVNPILNMAAACKKAKIDITTFMIASDPYLQDFIKKFSTANGGKAYYSGLNKLGEYVFEDYEKNKRKTMR